MNKDFLTKCLNKLAGLKAQSKLLDDNYVIRIGGVDVSDFADSVQLRIVIKNEIDAQIERLEKKTDQIMKEEVEGSYVQDDSKQ